MICGICGRMLKNTKSMELGYGPVCYRRVFGPPLIKVRAYQAKQAERTDDFHEYSIPGQMEISDFLKGI